MKIDVHHFLLNGLWKHRANCDAIRREFWSQSGTQMLPPYDILEHDINELSALLNRSDAFALGSPTINGDAVPPAWILLSHVDAINNKKKPVLVFGSYGWSGEAVPNLSARLTGLKMSLFGEGLKVCFIPSEEDLKKARELGKAFGETLK